MNAVNEKEAVETATEQKIRAALDLHWHASARGDLQAIELHRRLSQSKDHARHPGKSQQFFQGRR